MEPTFSSLLPSLLAIALALKSKNVTLSLLSGIALGALLLADLQPIAAFKELISLFGGILSETWVLKTLAFAVLVGSITELLMHSGGITAFTHFVSKRHNLVNSPQRALMMSYLIGLFIFIESSITSLIAGAVGRPLCDKEGVSRAKLAYVCDATSAPVSSLILLNGWGALLLGLLATQESSGYLPAGALDTLMASIPFNLYALIALVIVFLFIKYELLIGPMRHTKASKEALQTQESKATHINYMLLPILFMILCVFVFMYLTGNGNVLHGSGSSSIFYTTLATLLFMLLLFVPAKVMSFGEFMRHLYNGARKLLGVAFVLLLAFVISKVTGELHTGLYLASLAKEFIDPYIVYALVFVLSALIAFATGTSWGTFSIMIPIAVPMVYTMGLETAVAVGAVVSGGVFGDHCSPISDTTIISSIAAECDIIEHVRTQLPYALLGGAISAVLFLLLGVLG